MVLVQRVFVVSCSDKNKGFYSFIWNGVLESYESVLHYPPFKMRASFVDSHTYISRLLPNVTDMPSHQEIKEAQLLFNGVPFHYETFYFYFTSFLIEFMQNGKNRVGVDSLKGKIMKSTKVSTLWASMRFFTKNYITKSSFYETTDLTTFVTPNKVISVEKDIDLLTPMKL